MAFGLGGEAKHAVCGFEAAAGDAWRAKSARASPAALENYRQNRETLFNFDGKASACAYGEKALYRAPNNTGKPARMARRRVAKHGHSWLAKIKHQAGALKEIAPAVRAKALFA